MSKKKSESTELERAENGGGNGGNGGSGGALVVAPPTSLDVAVNPAAAAFLEECKGPSQEPPQIPIVRIDHKGGQFILPSGELVDHVSGYPIYYFQTRRWYERPPQPGAKGSPPDCWSGDLVKPVAASMKKQAELCALCPHDAFGTGRDGRSKACGEYTWLFLVNPEFGSPPLAAIFAPPSSIRSLLGTRFEAGFLGKAKSKHGAYQITWATFTLKQWGDTVQYCTLEGSIGPACTDMGMVKQLASLRNGFMEGMEKMRGQTISVEGE